MREELYHPLTAHFPLVLLGLSPFFLLVNAALGKKLSDSMKTHLDMALRFSLWGGLLSYLIVMFLGDMALDVVKQNACSLTAIYQHEEKAYFALYCFAFALTDEFIKVKWGEKLRLITLVSLFLGLFFLFETGHSGAELVYEKGTAVKGYVCP